MLQNRIKITPRKDSLLSRKIRVNLSRELSEPKRTKRQFAKKMKEALKKLRNYKGDLLDKSEIDLAKEGIKMIIEIRANEDYWKRYEEENLVAPWEAISKAIDIAQTVEDIEQGQKKE